MGGILLSDGDYVAGLSEGLGYKSGLALNQRRSRWKHPEYPGETAIELHPSGVGVGGIESRVGS